MTAPRAATAIKYQITLEKAVIEELRYGRRPDGSRAPMPWLKEWDKQSFLKGDLVVKPNENQVLFPTAVEEQTNSYKITGYLHSGKSEFNEEAELEFFTKNTKHSKVSDKLYEFSQGMVVLGFLSKKDGLFNPNRSEAKSDGKSQQKEQAKPSAQPAKP